MTILALSTSTSRGGAAVLGAGASAYADLAGHAERIFTAIDAAIEGAGITRASLTAVACDIGPGSFTGVRVGVATAKGIAIGLGLKVIGVPSLAAMAAAAFGEGAASEHDLVLAAIDAKKGEVFVAVYDASLAAVVPPEARPAEIASLRMEPADGRRVVVVGEVAAALGMADATRLARGPSLDAPDAAWIARRAAIVLERGGACDPALIEPLYGRAPDALPMTR